MTSFFISIILAVAAVSFTYNKITTRRGIIGKQMYQLLAVSFVIVLIISYTLLHFALGLK